ncbi:MAG: dihydroorotate dehydrogenase [Bacteroidales bacterium]|jgi:dihydroorotate dehydrogenase (NAD+) catalytic subunit|nr:dihydroorotate dehydrogenase [Bacteroidales bacterium]
MAELAINIAGLNFRNPVTTASGTFGYGEEFLDFLDPDQLGGIFVKAVTGKNRDGNAYPRMAETTGGMLNSVGLQNKGIDHFCREIYPKIRNFNTNIMVNVSGSTIEEYMTVAERINELDDIPAIELNISCPNVKLGGMAFGTVPAMAREVTAAVRKVYHKVMMVKLSPNVTNITEIARAVTDGGADVITLINTLLGMAIDAETQRPVLSTITGGLSGPAIKPVALRMVWQVHKAVPVPVIGLGGIMNATDAIEFILAGASAVQVGTANFIDPQASIKIIRGIEEYLTRHNISSIRELIGALRTDV